MNGLLSDLETIMKGNDGDAIRVKMQEVEGAWNGIFRQYQSSGQGQQEAPRQDTANAEAKEGDDDVVDAEFEES